MSYSFNVKAPTKGVARDEIDKRFSAMLAEQPIHQKDVFAAKDAANKFIDMVAEDDSKDVSVSVAGYLLAAADGKITAASFSVNTALVAK